MRDRYVFFLKLFLSSIIFVVIIGGIVAVLTEFFHVSVDTYIIVILTNMVYGVAYFLAFCLALCALFLLFYPIFFVLFRILNLLYRNDVFMSYVNSFLPYIKGVLSGSTNYSERVFVFLGLTQLLYFLFFILVKIFEGLDLFDAIPVITWLSFGIGIILLVLFFFKQITVKASLLFITGFAYLIALILFITIFMPDIYKTDGLWHFVSIIVYILSILKVSEVHTWYYEPTLPFMSGLLVWNILYSIVILIIAAGRSFVLLFFDGVRR
ncbi:MAG: hypothetical protein HQK67_07025 [Desulfamplus sp.]|nr:hypothetical protein [Desulfamplus sp.]